VVIPAVDLVTGAQSQPGYDILQSHVEMK